VHDFCVRARSSGASCPHCKLAVRQVDGALLRIRLRLARGCSSAHAAFSRTSGSLCVSATSS